MTSRRGSETGRRQRVADVVAAQIEPLTRFRAQDLRELGPEQESWADLTVGVTLSTTGPAASLGIPEKNTIALMPKTIGGEKVNYIVLDDASDTTTAVANTRKLLTEHKVDIIIGSTTTPNSLAMIDAVAEAQTPMISMAASARIVEPQDAKKRWVFKTPQNDIQMSLAIAEHMASAGVRTVGIDETSLRRGQHYITVVHDLDRKRLLFATEGASTARWWSSPRI